MPFPSPETKFPILLGDGTVYPNTVFLSAVLECPGLSVGRYTYYSDQAMPRPQELLSRLFPYLYGTQRIEIGQFCSIAQGVTFITDSANHRYDGISTFPFAIFDGMQPDRASMPGHAPRPTRVGHDCWLGHGAMILPGADLGNGVIVGAGAVVGGRIPDYTIVAGNPAKVIRRRFSEDVVHRLLALAWWDWPIEIILATEVEICGGDIDALEAINPHTY